MAHYEFLTSWFLRAPIERVFAEIEAVSEWPSWWKGVLAVEVLSPGTHGSVGMRTRNTWKSLLPYTLEFEAEVVRHEPPTRIEVAARGELVGRGTWELRRERDGTRVLYRWQVSTTRAWMNVLAPIARPFFRWNHDVVMRWGGEGLARRLGTTLESDGDSG